MITHLGVYLASKTGAPRGIRTHDPRFRRPMLCPLSYRRLFEFAILPLAVNSANAKDVVMVLKKLRAYGVSGGI